MKCTLWNVNTKLNIRKGKWTHLNRQKSDLSTNIQFDNYFYIFNSASEIKPVHINASKYISTFFLFLLIWLFFFQLCRFQINVSISLIDYNEIAYAIICYVILNFQTYFKYIIIVIYILTPLFFIVSVFKDSNIYSDTNTYLL